MTPIIRNLLAELRRTFEGLDGGRLVEFRLFGSYARDEAEPGSDPYLLVVLQGPLLRNIRREGLPV